MHWCPTVCVCVTVRHSSGFQAVTWYSRCLCSPTWLCPYGALQFMFESDPAAYLLLFVLWYKRAPQQRVHCKLQLQHVVFINDIIREDSSSDLTGVSGVHGRSEGCYGEQKEPDSAKCDGEKHRQSGEKGWGLAIRDPAGQQTGLALSHLPQTTAGIALNRTLTCSKRWGEFLSLYYYVGKDGGWKSTGERNNPTFTGCRKWFSEGKTLNIYGFGSQGNVDLCVCNCCVGLHLGVGQFSESTGCGRAAEEGAAAQALDWACVVPPSEEGGGARVQV